MNKSGIRVTVGGRAALHEPTSDKVNLEPSELVEEKSPDSAIIRIRPLGVTILTDQRVERDAADSLPSERDADEQRAQWTDEPTSDRTRNIADRLAERIQPPQQQDISEDVNMYKPTLSYVERKPASANMRPVRKLWASAGLAVVTGTLLGFALLAFYRDRPVADPASMPSSTDGSSQSAISQATSVAKIQIDPKHLYVYQLGVFREKKSLDTVMADQGRRGVTSVVSSTEPYQLIAGVTFDRAGNAAVTDALKHKGISFYIRPFTISSGTTQLSGVSDRDAGQVQAWLTAADALADRLTNTATPDTTTESLSASNQLDSSLQKLEKISTSSGWKQVYKRMISMNEDLHTAAGAGHQGVDAIGQDASANLLRLEGSLAKYYVDRSGLPSS